MFLTERQYSHARIQEFLSGGGGGAENSSYKLVFSLNVLGVQCFFFQKKTIILFRFQRGSNVFCCFFFWGGGGGQPLRPLSPLDPRMTRKLKKKTQNTDVNIQHSIYLYIYFFANYIILKQCSMFTQKKKLVASISRG